MNHDPLIDELVAIRSRESSAEVRRRAFESCLAERLAGRPRAEAAATLASLREHFADEARHAIERATAAAGRAEESERRADRLAAEHEAALTEADALRRERDALRAERDAARSEALELRRERAAPRAGTGPAAAVGASAAADVVAALAGLAGGRSGSETAAGLGADERRLYHAVGALLRFAQDYEMAVNVLMAEFSVGPQAGMDTRMMRGMKRVVRDRFSACLAGDDTALDELRRALATNARFLVELNAAYGSAVQSGSQNLLREIDPEQAISRNKRMLGRDYEGALRELARAHGDLSALSRAEIWERFFFEPFRERLAGGRADGRAEGDVTS